MEINLTEELQKVENLDLNTPITQQILEYLRWTPRKKFYGLAAIVAGAVYLHYYFRDDRKYAYERQYWVRRIVNTIWFPREGESFVENLFINFFKVPEHIDPPPPWHYLEVDYEPPELNEGDGPKFSAFVEGVEVFDELTYYILQGLKVFGHFEKEHLCEILEASRLHHLTEGSYLFSAGYKDVSLFVVLKGRIDVILLESDSLLKTLVEGGQLLSVISFIATITGNPIEQRGLEAIAVVDTDIISIPYEVIYDVMKKKSPTLFQAVRNMMERVMGATFVVMNQLMGLRNELLDERSRGSRFVDFDISRITAEVKQDALRGALKAFEIDPKYISLLNKCRVTYQGKKASIQVKSRIGFTVEADIIYVHLGEVKALGHSSGMEFYISAGECFGGLNMMTNIQDLFLLKVPKKAITVCIPFEVMGRILEVQPEVSLKICRQVIGRLSGLTMLAGLSFEYRNIRHKTILFNQGEESHSIYYVTNGRLRSVAHDTDGKEIQIGEVSKDNWIGLFEAVTNTDRRKSYMAVRDSELVVVPASLLEYAKIRFPRVAVSVLEFVSNRIARNYVSTNIEEILTRAKDPRAVSPQTIFILPFSAEIPSRMFALELLRHHKHGKRGITVCLQDAINILGRDVDSDAQYELAAWVNRLEELYPIVIYVGDTSNRYFNLRGILQADRIVIVADPSKSEPDLIDLEKTMLQYSPLSKKDLVLIYKRPSRFPQGTKFWIKERPWIIRHHHVRFDKEFFDFLGDCSELEIAHGYPAFNKPINIHSDMARFCRWICGNSVALVFGGGGAKGAAHIGFLRTLLSLNIPVDMLAGVSIGSLISAHLSLFEKDIDRLERDVSRWFLGMHNWWIYLLDSGFIFRSLSNGQSFDQSLIQLIGGIQIEDLWTPYFCVSTDMTGKCARAHYHGSVWQYVRASMNLVGYFAPYRDPIDGHYLMDGGYIQLVPVDFMRSYGARFVLAMDISAGKGVSGPPYGDTMTGAEALISRVLTSCPIPNWYEMAAELTFIQSAFYLQLISILDSFNVYLKLPTELFTGESFGSFPDIVHWGHRHGRSTFEGFDPRSPFSLVWARLNQVVDPGFQLNAKRRVYRKNLLKRKKKSQYDGDDFDSHTWRTELFGERLAAVTM